MEASVAETADAGEALVTPDSAPSMHQPVMVDEVCRCLSPRPGAVVLDGTAGTGGHSLALLPRLLPGGRLIAVDRDADALAIARLRLVEFQPAVAYVHDDYRHLSAILQRLGLGGLDGLVLDVGMSSLQVDSPERGLSFLRPGPLDMRMDRTQPLTAADVVHRSSAEELAILLSTLGEERYARRIAQAIVAARAEAPVTTTTALARLVVGAYPPRARHSRLHPATRTFQALRIAVNDELGALAAVLDSLAASLRPGARAVVLTYHSLEDRLVKRAFLHGAREGHWSVLTKKPLRPSLEEVRRNPRARSAKLRAVERLGSA